MDKKGEIYWESKVFAILILIFILWLFGAFDSEETSVSITPNYTIKQKLDSQDVLISNAPCDKVRDLALQSYDGDIQKYIQSGCDYVCTKNSLTFSKEYFCDANTNLIGCRCERYTTIS